MAKKLFTNAKTRAGLDSAVADGTFNTHIAFIEEAGEEGIYAGGKVYQTVPSDGRKGQVLMNNGVHGVWQDFETLDLLSYGVEWKPNVADPVLTRVGNMNYHKTLPIQSGMKGCIYDPKEKKVVYWLDEDNWNYKKGGNPDKGETEQLARLDGYDGEVMVYVPEFYIKSWDEADRREVRISQVRIDETWEHQPAVFLGAYRDTVLNTVPEDMGYLRALPANSALSVANTEAYCRGGNNSSANDADEDVFKRQLGKCRTGITRGTFRTYARNSGKEIMSYRQYKNIMYWLYVIEYANFNSQATYNASLTLEGFRQGGLGTGLANVSNWYEYNSCYPISPNGYTNEFGNGTGIKLIAPLGPAPVGNVYATRWRGLENPFGDTWYNVDGIIIDADANNHPNNMNYVYTTDDPAKYGDTLANIADMVLSGLEIHQDGYTKEWNLGSTAEIIPRLMGGNTTQYKCDYHGTGNKNAKLRTLLLGGCTGYSVDAGLGYFFSSSNVDSYGTDAGFRSVSVV